MALPAYVVKGTLRRALGYFNSIVTTGINTRSINTGITASTTQTLAAATALTAEINVIATVATSGNAVKLPALSPGQCVDIYNAGANPAKVFPAASGAAIDGGSNGAAVTLTNGNRARFTCTAANTIVSAMFGAVSA